MPSITYQDQYSPHTRSYRVPVWATERLYTLDGIHALMRRSWPGDLILWTEVQSYARELTVVGYLDFPDMPALPDGAEQETQYGDHLREIAMIDHVRKRGRTRNDRALFDPAGHELYVPSNNRPSPGDSVSRWDEKSAAISNLRTDDLTNEEND